MFSFQISGVTSDFFFLVFTFKKQFEVFSINNTHSSNELPRNKQYCASEKYNG